MTFGGRRSELKHHLSGDGIEIGALHSPFDVSGLAITRIRYVDRFDVDELRKHYPELKEQKLVPVDIIDDGQVLGSIPDGSLDFVIANHMIEHCDNPLRTIRNWISKLKPGGICFIAVPDQRKGWDERREVTPLAHMIEDYRATPALRKERNRQHFREWVELVGNQKNEELIQHLIDIDYSIHYHVFTFDSFRQMLDYAAGAMRLPLEIIDSMEPSETSWESIFVLRRTANPMPPDAVASASTASSF